MRPLYDLASVFAEQLSIAEQERDRIYEAVIAIVVDNKDPEKLNRVKVKIPILAGNDTTEWIPMIMLGAGKNRGWFFIPEKDDEVLLMFEHGDINRPVVVGALYNGKDKPPEKNSGSNPKRVIKSRCGNKITFDDEKGELIIEDGGGKGKIKFEASSNKMTFEASSGDVCIQTPAGNTQVVAKDAKFTASGNVEIHAGAGIKLEGKNVTIKASDITLSGSTCTFNTGESQAAANPSASPQECKDPYGS